MHQNEIEFVVYDEVEMFREWDDVNFNYPYEKRKTKTNRFRFGLEEPGKDYNVNTTSIKFEKS